MDVVARLKRPGRPRIATRDGAVGAESPSPESRSVRRTLDIFELMVATREPLNVAAVIERLRIPKSTAYELVRMLAESGHLEELERRAVWRPAAAAEPSQDVREQAISS